MIKKLGVVGAGTMGNGIAQVAAVSGYEVVIRDLDERLLEKGLETIKKNLQRSVNKGALEEAAYINTINRIKLTEKLEDLADADFIIEAIIEKMEIKKTVFRELDEVCQEQAVLATNTSGLSITEIGATTSRPDKVIGLHFFNPVPVMKLVEVIKGEGTSEETYVQTMELAKQLGKEAITVNDSPLFAVNRILVPMINEAIFVLAEGTASAEDIDKGMVLGANHPIGPLALADLVGLDTLLMVQETLYEETCDSKFRPCPLLKKLVRAGHLGRKTGRGFYTY